MSDFSFIPPTSVVTIPGTHASAAFTPNTSEVFKEEHDIAPVFITDKMKYIPWGADNQMPYNIIDLIESDETLATCQMFNAEVCYGSGLVYDTEHATAQVLSQVEDFMADNDIASYFLGVCLDFKHFGFAVSVIILNEDGTRIVRLARKQACYVRFVPADTLILHSKKSPAGVRSVGDFFELYFVACAVLYLYVEFLCKAAFARFLIQ